MTATAEKAKLLTPEIEAFIDVGRREGILEPEEGELLKGLDYAHRKTSPSGDADPSGPHARAAPPWRCSGWRRPGSPR